MNWSFHSRFFIAVTSVCFIVPFTFFVRAVRSAENLSKHVLISLNLATEQHSEFFTWFHLDPFDTPTASVNSLAWHRFRPSGTAFHALVELDVLAAADGTIGAASLGLDRSFIDDRGNGPFARDAAKSFLSWAVRNPSPPIAALIGNLADFSGFTIFMRGPPPAPPPPDPTGGYRVYLGKDGNVSFTDDGVTFAFTNFRGPLPQGPLFEATGQSSAGEWLRIDVRFPAGR